MQAKTALRSTAMRVLASESLLNKRRAMARFKRKLLAVAPVVHYFHQVDDPYSHLAVQKLAAFADQYTIRVQPHLVSAPLPDFQGDTSRFAHWAIRDAQAIAEGFDARLSTSATLTGADTGVLGLPNHQAVRSAEAELARLLDGAEPDGLAQRFAAAAYAYGDELWTAARRVEIKARSHSAAAADAPARHANHFTAAGDRLRKKLGHYQGAMFWFDGEWYWGVDRLHLLEARLRDEGFGNASTPLVCPLPSSESPKNSEPQNAAAVTLEYFPSLRSPYTAIGNARVVKLVETTGIALKLRPVMPMLMRGIPAPQAKQNYIIQDAAREARFYQVPFGNFVDPFGEPVKRAFALYPAAARLGRGLQYVSAYLDAAFANGTDITNNEGLAKVAGEAGLDFAKLSREAEGDDWNGELEDNVNDMLGAGLWGVPSFRVSGGSLPDSFACWGQDRIWRVAAEITRRCEHPRF